jgi:5-methylcytosine-specific restriction endonuclease McrA
MTYAEKLKDPRWQKKRLEVMERDDFKCQLCNDNTTTLHIHHKSYDFGKDPWDYNLDNFNTLCIPCHELEELAKNKLKELILRIEKQGTFKHKIVMEFYNNVYLKLYKNG